MSECESSTSSLGKIMRRLAGTLVLGASVLGGGCASNPEGGSTHRQVRIPKGEPIQVIWHLGGPKNFQNSEIAEELRRWNTDSPAYTACTDAIFKGSFVKNGYPAASMRVGDPRIALFRSATAKSYVLLIRNTEITQPRVLKSAMRFSVDVSLFEKRSGELLWRDSQYLYASPQDSAIAANSILRKLAVAGFLDIRPDELRDHRGATPDDELSSACPNA